MRKSEWERETERERERKSCKCVCVCVGRDLNNYINFVQCSARQVRFPQLIDIILNSFTLINDIIPSDRSERGTAGVGTGWAARWVELAECERERQSDATREERRQLTDERGTRTLRLIWRNFHSHSLLSLLHLLLLCLPSACSCSSSSQRAVEFHYKLKNCSFLFENTLLILQLPWIVLIR